VEILPWRPGIYWRIFLEWKFSPGGQESTGEYSWSGNSHLEARDLLENIPLVEILIQRPGIFWRIFQKWGSVAKPRSDKAMEWQNPTELMPLMRLFLYFMPTSGRPWSGKA